MRSKTAWDVVFITMAAAVLAVVVIPACMDGDRSTVINPSHAGGTVIKVYESDVSGPFSLPGTLGATVLKSFTFVPTNGANDVMLRVEMDGTYTGAGPDGGDTWLILEVLDSLGNYAGWSGSSVVQGFASGPFKGSTSFHGIVNQPPGSTIDSVFTIRLVASSPFRAALGQVNSVKFRVVVAENVTIVSPSQRFM